MSAADNGGPAFPFEHSRRQNGREDGMTMRDYFAAKSMTGCLPGSHMDPNELAAWAYRMADAMLQARKGGAA